MTKPLSEQSALESAVEVFAEIPLDERLLTEEDILAIVNFSFRRHQNGEERHGQYTTSISELIDEIVQRSLKNDGSK